MCNNPQSAFRILRGYFAIELPVVLWLSLKALCTGWKNQLRHTSPFFIVYQMWGISAFNPIWGKYKYIKKGGVSLWLSS
jgi:hypothetical protein